MSARQEYDTAQRMRHAGSSLFEISEVTGLSIASIHANTNPPLSREWYRNTPKPPEAVVVRSATIGGCPTTISDTRDGADPEGLSRFLKDMELGAQAARHARLKLQAAGTGWDLGSLAAHAHVSASQLRAALHRLHSDDDPNSGARPSLDAHGKPDAGNGQLPAPASFSEPAADPDTADPEPHAAQPHEATP